jgi:hypothetical protein
LDKSTPTQRPDLFSAAQSGGGSRRILASLENSGKAQSPAARLARIRPSYLVMLLMLLAILSAGVASISYYGMAPAQQSKAWTSAAPLSIHAPQAAPADTPEEVQRLAAAIVNEPLPAIVPARHRQAANQAMPAAAPAAAARPALRAERSPQARPGIQVNKTHSTAHEGTLRLASAAPPDSDVTLLAALVAHSGSQASAMHYSRDVVERRDGDSTDALLRRCQRLGGAEAGLCRARICNGLWLHETACRMPVSD